MNSSNYTVRLSNIFRSYQRGIEKVRALEEISIACFAGEFLGLTGPSGSGKTSLLNIIGLAHAPSAGQLEIDKIPVDFDDEESLVHLRRSKVGYIFQTFNLIASLSALDNVALSLLLNGKKLSEARSQARDHLTSLGLAERVSHAPYQLSGGEMQRVAVARASIHRPAIVVADEPTGNLDTHSGDRVLELLKELSEQGTTVIMASHSERALAYCDRVLSLSDGRLVTASQAG